MADFVIKLPDNREIRGSHPVVIIGPNGSGKTIFGAQVASKNNAELISATRNLQLPDDIPLQKKETAEQESEKQKKQQISNTSGLANDINSLLAKLKAEDSESATNYRNRSIAQPGDEPEVTKIIQLTNLWNTIFPKREVDFTTYSPKVKASHRKQNDPYGISKMSGGERVALYLLARILDAKPGLIIVDEPEIHFHGVLARKFWNELEILRNDCRFVYITHDLSFAVSRNNVQFINVLSESKQTILPAKTSIPDEIIETVLGAATFSISAKKIIFCEGSQYGKRDDEFYSAWLGGVDVAVIPVGSCEEVLKSVKVINNNTAIKGVKALGVIDRDYRPSKFLSNPPQNVKPLDLFQIESLFCIQGVFCAVAKYKKIKKADRESKYLKFISEAKEHFRTNKKEKNKIILERVKQKTEQHSRKALYKIKTKDDIKELKKEYLDALKPKTWSFSPAKFFTEEKKQIETALKKESETDIFLQLFPGKTLFGRVVCKLSMSKADYIRLIISALNSNLADKKNPFKVLKKEILKSLKQYKPF